MKKSFKIPLFNAKVSVHTDIDIMEMFNRDAVALCVSMSNQYSLFFSKNNFTTPIISHECFHLVCNLAENYNIKISDENTEIFAMLMEFVVDKIERLKNELV